MPKRCLREPLGKLQCSQRDAKDPGLSGKGTNRDRQGPALKCPHLVLPKKPLHVSVPARVLVLDNELTPPVAHLGEKGESGKHWATRSHSVSLRERPLQPHGPQLVSDTLHCTFLFGFFLKENKSLVRRVRSQPSRGKEAFQQCFSISDATRDVLRCKTGLGTRAMSQAGLPVASFPTGHCPRGSCHHSDHFISGNSGG